MDGDAVEMDILSEFAVTQLKSPPNTESTEFLGAIELAILMRR